MNNRARYRYLYYVLYKWNLERFGKADFPQLNGLLLLSLFSFTNFVTVLLLFDVVLRVDLFQLAFPNSFAAGGIAMLNLLVNYFFIYANGKNTKIVEYFNNLSKVEVNKFRKFSYLYFISSILIMFLVVLVWCYKGL